MQRHGSGWPTVIGQRAQSRVCNGDAVGTVGFVPVVWVGIFWRVLQIAAAVRQCVGAVLHNLDGPIGPVVGEQRIADRDRAASNRPAIEARVIVGKCRGVDVHWRIISHR